MTKTGREALFHPPIVRSALRTALVIGTVLVVINHLGDLLAGRLTPGLVVEVVLTYVVPYAVSTYGSISVSLTPPTPPGGQEGSRR